MATLKEKANNILLEKEENLIPENIKSGVNIFNVIGNYTGNDILLEDFISIQENSAEDTGVFTVERLHFNNTDYISIRTKVKDIIALNTNATIEFNVPIDLLNQVL